MTTFFVNRDRVDISDSVAADTPLLWILRDSLNLTGRRLRNLPLTLAS